MNSPAAICRVLEERVRPGQDQRGAARWPEGLVTKDMIRVAERDAAHAQHTLDMADPSCPAERLAELRRRAGEAHARACRLRCIGCVMATKKKGVLVPSPQWWKHLRDWKRIFWRRHRRAERKVVRNGP